jgi:hypothetical protein
MCYVAVGLGPMRLRCLIVGHDDRFNREAGRLSLRCDQCGRNTIGWTIGPPAWKREVHVLTAYRDVVWVLVLVFLLPVWMVLGLGVVAVVVVRQLYWRARGITTVVSQLASRVRSLQRHRAAAVRTCPSPAGGPIAATAVGSLGDAPAIPVLSPLVPGVSER